MKSPTARPLGNRRSPTEFLSARQGGNQIRDAAAWGPRLQDRAVWKVRGEGRRSARQRGALERLEREGDAEAVLAELSEILLGGLPAQLERLRTALEPESLTLEHLRDIVLLSSRKRDAGAQRRP